MERGVPHLNTACEWANCGLSYSTQARIKTGSLYIYITQTQCEELNTNLFWGTADTIEVILYMSINPDEVIAYGTALHTAILWRYVWKCSQFAAFGCHTCFPVNWNHWLSHSCPQQAQ